jgi:hypothetical protein
MAERLKMRQSMPFRLTLPHANGSVGCPQRLLSMAMSLSSCKERLAGVSGAKSLIGIIVVEIDEQRIATPGFRVWRQ